MTTRFLLDTNALLQLVRDPRSTVGTRLREVGDSNVFTSIIVACELRYGARKRGSAALTERVERLLASIVVGPLESKGTPIGSNDLSIAAHALEQQATLVTDNVAEFERVPGLHIENWVLP